MLYAKKPAFERCWKKLTPQRQEEARKALEQLINFFDKGIRSDGLGLKKLRDNFYEIRSSLKDRILFRMSVGHVEFIIIGNHDEIHRFLKRQ